MTTENDLDGPEDNDTPFFSPEEARVVGSLMEKHLATPQYYPLTINALVAACNQKSNREPVMSLTEGKVAHLVNDLAERELVDIDFGDRSRKVSHRINKYFSLRNPQLAVLCVLLLRKAQTFHDIKRRTERLHKFGDEQALHAVIDSLINHELVLVKLIPKGSGQREDRYIQTLSGHSDTVEPTKADAPATHSDEDRIVQLERRVAVLEAQLVKLQEASGTKLDR